MLVYGDVEQQRDTRAACEEIVAALEDLASLPPGLSRHSKLVSVFIETAELMRGTIDWEFATTGRDEQSPFAVAAMPLLLRLAACVDRSWRTGFGDLCAINEIAPGLKQLPLPSRIRTKPAEGYAFYAVYPESYAEAARRSGLAAETRIIGIRSIGLGLAAMVAAGLGAEPPLTVRPIGHPFARSLSVHDSFAEQLLAGDPPAYAIVDEGPGLSGSSFGAVADWLEAHGVDPALIHFFPSHGSELGPQASEPHRKRWAAAPRHHVTFEELFVDTHRPEHRLQSWVEGLVGPLDAQLQDISGGAWRILVPGAKSLPAAPPWERRKYLARRGDNAWLVKFAGIGREAERKGALAELLADKAFSPAVVGTVHGFVIQRWQAGANLVSTPVARGDLVDVLGRYLGFRATLEAREDAGAPLTTLREMALYNTAEGLGDSARDRLEARLSPAEELAGKVRRVWIDGRLQAWEWIVSPDRRLLKTDALDHAQGHDFIGAQDIAWDVAGAIVEHNLSATEVEALAAAIASSSGHAVQAPLVDFLLPCYLAFQLGAWTMSTGAEAAITRRYAAKLSDLIGVETRSSQAP